MKRWLEEGISGIAARQHGVVTRPQLLQVGLTPGAIQRLRASGRLQPLHQGVYLVGPIAPPRAQVMSAVLACGDGARASHRTAASLWEIAPPRVTGLPVEVKLPGNKIIRRPGIRAYRALGLAARPPANVDGIPTTDPIETLIDLAAVVGASDLEKLVARAERARLVTLGDLSTAVDRHPGRRGIAALRAILGQAGGPAFTRSDLEERFRDAVRRFQLAPPRFNTRIHGHELDCFWPESSLAVELDGAAFHQSWQSQQNDRRRDADLATFGIQVIRITWKQLVGETHATMVRLAEAMAVRRDRLQRGPGR